MCGSPCIRFSGAFVSGAALAGHGSGRLNAGDGLPNCHGSPAEPNSYKE